MVFLVVILSLEDRRRFFFQPCSILFKIRDSSLLPSSHNCFRLWEFFSPIRSNSGVFSVCLSEGHQFRIIHSSFQLSFSKSNRCIIQVYSLISSWSLRSLVSKLSHVFSFILNSYGGSSKILSSFVHHINLFVVSTRPVVHGRPFKIDAISILILSTRISSMPIPLLVINLNWWRISIM